MTLLALGLSHQTAPLALRERLAFSPEEAAVALRALAARPGVAECALLSTCNRTEVYGRLEGADPGVVRDWLCAQRGIDPAALDEFLYRHHDADAVRHLYRVAAGIDSLVLGEPQILGQVKTAYHEARSQGTLGPALERLFQSAFAVSKRVRTETRIGASPVSVAYAAVRLAEQVFGELRRCAALLVGAGDTIELVAQHLNQRGIGALRIANRSLANAQALAQRYGAQASTLDALERWLPEADLVISSTASPAPLLSRSAVAQALAARRHRPMLIVDLAVPRDVEPGVAELEDVFLYTVDDLGDVIADSLRARRDAARDAEAMLELQVEHFLAWFRALDGHGALRAFRARGERDRDAALAKAQAALAAGQPADAVLRQLAHALTNKLLHGPSANLRAAALRGDAELLRAAERLLGGADEAP